MQRLGPVDTVSHHPSLLPTVDSRRVDGRVHHEVGAQPLLVHGEAWLASRLSRWTRAQWTFGWAVNSRYAQILLATQTPYAIWEATTLRDELRATSGRQLRRVRVGTGAGLMLHRALLPFDERLERRLYRGAWRLFAMSEYTRNLMIATHGVSPSDVQVLPHPPSPAFLRALSNAVTDAMTVPRRESGPLALLFVGRADDPRKQFWLLAEACAQLVADGIDVHLTVVGSVSGAWRAWLAAHPIASIVSVRGAVTTEELARLYASHDVLVLSSRQEGFGIVVAEAFHAGLPVVTTRCGGPEFMVRESGAGILVDHDAGAFAHAVATLADASRREPLARRARDYARTHLSFDMFAARVAEVTLDVARGVN
jgi:glycosyltransferase involved in cell wall biosynthesis